MAKKAEPKSVKKSPKSSASSNGNGANGAGNNETIQEPDPEILEKITAIRSRINETFGQVAISMMMIPRYKHLSIADLNQVLLEPLIRDRVAIAKSGKIDDLTKAPLAGFAIWASVSDEVDVKIREQIRAGVFPVRLNGNDWNSGENNWLLDIIAPSQQLTMAVIANFKQVVKEGDLRIHPLITRLVDAEALKKMGATPAEDGAESQSAN